MKKVITLLIVYLNLYSSTIENLSSKEMERLKQLCIYQSSKVKTTVKGNVNISPMQLKKFVISGEGIFTSTEITGLGDKIDKISAAQITEIRKCMKEYIDMIRKDKSNHTMASTKSDTVIHTEKVTVNNFNNEIHNPIFNQ